LDMFQVYRLIDLGKENLYKLTKKGFQQLLEEPIMISHYPTPLYISIQTFVR